MKDDFTPCTNALDCSGVNTMAIQLQSGSCQSFLAMWDQSVQPTYDSMCVCVCVFFCLFFIMSICI